MAIVTLKFDVDDKAALQKIERIKKSLGQLDNRPGDFVPSFDVSNLPDSLRQISTLQGALGSLKGLGAVGLEGHLRDLMQGNVGAAMTGSLLAGNLMGAASGALHFAQGDRQRRHGSLARWAPRTSARRLVLGSLRVASAKRSSYEWRMILRHDWLEAEGESDQT